MQRRHITLGLGAALAGLPLIGARAQGDYPSKTITLVASFAGMTDQTGRILGEVVSAKSGQPVVVDTRAGANGIVATEYVMKAAPDGYTLLHTTNSTHAANQSLYKTLSYDYVRDFIPVSGVLQGSLMIVAPTASPYKNLADLTEAARKQPGKLSFGWGASAVRAAVELYRQNGKLEFLSVPYKTNAQAVVDMIGGRIDFMALDPLTAGPQIQSGKMRVLAVTGPRRIEGYADIPTVQESGIPGYVMTYWQGIYAPKGTPDAVVRRAGALFQEAVRSPQAQKFMSTVGAEPFPISSEELMKFQQAEAQKWRAITVAAGIQPE